MSRCSDIGGPERHLAAETAGPLPRDAPGPSGPPVDERGEPLFSQRPNPRPTASAAFLLRRWLQTPRTMLSFRDQGAIMKYALIAVPRFLLLFSSLLLLQ